MERRVGLGTALVERGCVDSDEIGRRNAREVLAWGDPGMDRRKTERMHEFVETGSAPRCRPPRACVQPAL